MTTQPEALRLADWISHRTNIMLQDREAAAELRRQHARIEELEAQLEEANSSNAKLDCSETQLIKERDQCEEIIDLLCDAVLGENRYEWSNMYTFADAVLDVETKMAVLDEEVKGLYTLRTRLAEIEKQEPYAYFYNSMEDGCVEASVNLPGVFPLYAHPVAAEMPGNEGVFPYKELHPVAAPATGNIVMDSYNQMCAMKAAPAPQQSLISKALAAIELAMDNIRPHSDNCFLHDTGEYNACFCGKDSLTNYLQEVVEELATELNPTKTAPALTDAEIEDFGFNMLPTVQHKDFIAFARAIESAVRGNHG